MGTKYQLGVDEATIGSDGTISITIYPSEIEALNIMQHATRMMRTDYGPKEAADDILKLAEQIKKERADGNRIKS